jgi:hypothetical protein
MVRPVSRMPQRKVLHHVRKGAIRKGVGRIKESLEDMNILDLTGELKLNLAEDIQNIKSVK